MNCAHTSPAGDGAGMRKSLQAVTRLTGSLSAHPPVPLPKHHERGPPEGEGRGVRDDHPDRRAAGAHHCAGSDRMFGGFSHLMASFEMASFEMDSVIGFV